MAKRWEYLVISENINTISEKEWQDKINELGEDGWELTGVVSAGDPETAAVYCPVVMFFKREK